MTVEEMKNVDIRTVDPETLVDVRTVHISEELSGDERVKEFVRQIKNPFCYRVGNMVVKNVYSREGMTIHDCFVQLVKNL